MLLRYNDAWPLRNWEDQVTTHDKWDWVRLQVMSTACWSQWFRNFFEENVQQVFFYIYLGKANKV